MATCDSTTLLEIACDNGLACLDDRNLTVATAVIFCQILQAANPMAQCDANSILQSACNSGIACLGDRDLKVVLVQLACEILQAGGGGGNSCLLCGAVDPVDAPDCTCAIYYNTVTMRFFIWVGFWNPIIL